MCDPFHVDSFQNLVSPVKMFRLFLSLGGWYYIFAREEQEKGEKIAYLAEM